MLKQFLIFVTYIFILALSSHVYAQPENVTLFQVGNASALFSGAIEGDMNFSQLKKYGNFGLGTFNGIKGEMIALDGNFYQIGQNGKTIPVDSSWKTPYAELITFSPMSSINFGKIENYKFLKSLIYSKLDNKNVPYALQIKGHFDYLKLRSRSPRAALQTKNIIEETYTFENISGTLVGYWFPEYLLNLTVPGFHFHFISDDKKRSGHVLDLKIEDAKFSFIKIDKIELQFPNTEIYAKAKIVAPTLNTYKKAQIYDTN